EETSYRSRRGDYRGRDSSHAHHGGCALEGGLVGPGAWRLRRRRDRRKRIGTALLCESVLRLRVRSLLRLRLSGLLRLCLKLSAVLRLRRADVFRLLRHPSLTNGPPPP